MNFRSKYRASAIDPKGTQYRASAIDPKGTQNKSSLYDTTEYKELLNTLSKIKSSGTNPNGNVLLRNLYKLEEIANELKPKDNNNPKPTLGNKLKKVAGRLKSKDKPKDEEYNTLGNKLKKIRNYIKYRNIFYICTKIPKNSLNLDSLGKCNVIYTNKDHILSGVDDGIIDDSIYSNNEYVPLHDKNVIGKGSSNYTVKLKLLISNKILDNSDYISKTQDGEYILKKNNYIIINSYKKIFSYIYLYGELITV